MEIKDFVIFKNNYKKSEKAPDYILKTKIGESFVEVGAGWKKIVKGKVDEKGNPVTYISCRFKEDKPKTDLSPDDIKAIQDARNRELAQKQVVEDANTDFDIPF